LVLDSTSADEFGYKEPRKSLIAVKKSLLENNRKKQKGISDKDLKD
jgi:hypothetical protein